MLDHEFLDDNAIDRAIEVLNRALKKRSGSYS